MTYVIDSRYSCRETWAASIRSGLGCSLLRIRQTLELWYDRQRQRRQLIALDDHLLRDIGIDRISALKEASKPFWR